MRESNDEKSIHPEFSVGGLASYRLKFIQVTLWVSLFVVWTFPFLGNAVPEAASHRTAILILTICSQIPLVFLFFQVVKSGNYFSLWGKNSVCIALFLMDPSSRLILQVCLNNKH